MEKSEKIIRFDQLQPRGNFPVMVRDTYQDEFAAAHSHDYIEIALVHNGRGTHLNHFNDGTVLANTIIKGDLFTILPGEIHSYANCKSYLVYNLCIQVDFFRTLYAEMVSLKYYKQFLTSSRPAKINQLHLLPGRFSMAEEKLRRLATALRSNSPSAMLAVKLALTDFLFTVFDDDSGNWKLQENSFNDRLSQSIIQMEEHPEKKFDLRTFARQAGMSCSGYSHQFKQVIGVPPGDYCLFLKLDKVRKLLENKSMSMTEIALSSGFSDSNYMIRAFKKRFGITPGSYRTNLLQIDR